MRLLRRHARSGQGSACARAAGYISVLARTSGFARNAIRNRTSDKASGPPPAAGDSAATPLLSTTRLLPAPWRRNTALELIDALGMSHRQASAFEYVYRAGRKPGVSKVDDRAKRWPTSNTKSPGWKRSPSHERVGIDPSLRRTGWAYVAGQAAPATGRTGRSVATTTRAARGAPEAAQAGVTHAAIEDVYLGRNFRTAATLAEVRGRIKGACAAAGIEVRDVPSMTWKAGVLAFNGRLPQGRKEQKAAAVTVAQACGANPRNSDEADAVCIADYGRRAWTAEARAIARRPK